MPIMEKTMSNGPTDVAQTNGEAEPGIIDTKPIPPTQQPASQVIRVPSHCGMVDIRLKDI